MHCRLESHPASGRSATSRDTACRSAWGRAWRPPPSLRSPCRQRTPRPPAAAMMFHPQSISCSIGVGMTSRSFKGRKGSRCWNPGLGLTHWASKQQPRHRVQRALTPSDIARRHMVLHIRWQKCIAHSCAGGCVQRGPGTGSTAPKTLAPCTSHLLIFFDACAFTSQLAARLSAITGRLAPLGLAGADWGRHIVATLPSRLSISACCCLLLLARVRHLPASFDASNASNTHTTPVSRHQALHNAM